MTIDVEADRQMAEAARRDPAAFEAIFLRYFDPLYRHFVLRTGCAAEAETRAIEVLSRARALLPTSEWSGRPLLLWLFDLARQSSYGPQRSHSSPASDLPALADGEEIAEARRLLGRLDARTAEVLVLRFALDWSFQDSATLTGTSVASIAMQVYRAVVKVHRRLGAEHEGG